MVDADGRAISDDCTMCHSMLAFESPDPFAYLDPADTTAVESEMADYLRGEFLRSYVESD
jgi:hypothetical protein